MKNLLIITQVFPPSSAIGARRFGEMAPYLEEFGYRPWIVTMKFEGPTFQGLPSDQIFSIGEYTRGELSDARWASDLHWIRFIEDCGFRPIYLDPALRSWAPKVFQRIDDIKNRIQNIDCIIGSFGPPSSLCIANYLSQRLKAPWIADFRDLGALRFNARNLFIRTIDRLIEKWWVRNALGITTVSPLFTEILQTEYQKPTRTIYNGYDATDVLTDPQFSQSHEPYLYYAGQIYPAQLPGIRIILEALTKTPHLKLKFRILGPRYLETEIRETVSSLNLSNRVDFLPCCSRETSTLEAYSSRANIVLANSYEPSHGIIPAKFFSLLPSRSPLLVIGKSNSDIGRILSETKRGRICESAGEVIEFLKDIERNTSLYRSIEPSLEKYSKRNLARELAHFLDSLLTS